ncbi:hypothetical protein [Arthrobacter sp. zg-Y1116]|uniref:hypothetical protein n=1 Tax=Arthrobacter sp. zg-Y1116 TaxID=2964611 RepID=UPI0021069862|nr:hypothetical protein [Arthrobacter sp. zg-Y1116]MCQ1946827.1 hypothetical protein [Arthrobacter sp. zg-Y1116]
MGTAIASLVIGAVVTFGIAVLVIYLRKLGQLKRHPARPRMEVRFSPKGLVGLALLVGAMLLAVCLGLFLVVYRDLPIYAVSFSLILLAGTARPVYLSKAGLPFVVVGIGEELNPKPVPAPAYGGATAPVYGGAAAPPQYPGFANAPAGFTPPPPPAPHQQ